MASSQWCTPAHVSDAILDWHVHTCRTWPVPLTRMRSTCLFVDAQGIQKARDVGFIDWNSGSSTWSLEEYEHYEQVWIMLPTTRALASPGPSACQGICFRLIDAPTSVLQHGWAPIAAALVLARALHALWLRNTRVT
jgi:hypothetical protein